MNFFPIKIYPRLIQNNTIQQQNSIWKLVSKFIGLINNKQSMQVNETNVMLCLKKEQTITQAIQIYERIKKSGRLISQRTQFLVQMLQKYQKGYEKLVSTYQKTSAWRYQLQQFFCLLLEVLKLQDQKISFSKKNRLEKFLIQILKYADLDAKQVQIDDRLKQSINQLRQLTQSQYPQASQFLMVSNPFQTNIKNRLSSYFQELQTLCEDNEPPFWELRISGNDIQCCACQVSANSQILYYLKPAFSKQMSPPITQDEQLQRFFNVLSWSLKFLSLKNDSYMLSYTEKGKTQKITFEKIIEKIKPIMQQISGFQETGEACLQVISSLAKILDIFPSSMQTDKRNLEVVSGLIIKNIGQLKSYFEKGQAKRTLQSYDKSLNLLEKRGIQQAFEKLLLKNSALQGAQNLISAISNTVYFLLTAIRTDLQNMDSIVKDIMDKTFISTQTRQSKKKQIAKKFLKKLQAKNPHFVTKFIEYFFPEKI